MVKSVVRAFHWSPKIINKMFADDYDYNGLFFWYDDVVKTDKEVKASYNKGKK